MLQKLLGAVVGLVVAGIATSAQAATFYTDQTAFDAALSSPLAWAENFEGFTPSVLPAVPLSIGAGQAEIFTDGPQQIYVQLHTGNLVYWNVEELGDPPGLGPQTIISSPTSSSLSLGAFSFDYNKGGTFSTAASFVSSAGTQEAFLIGTSVSYPNGENGEDVPLFLGWLGAPDEQLLHVFLSIPRTGIVLDNFRGFEFIPAVPLPAALPLFGTGLALMGFIGWRRKRRMAAEAAA